MEIALYAEMYGFPLTIYVITSLPGIDVPYLHMRGGGIYRAGKEQR